MFEANSRLLSKDKMPSARYFLKLKTAVQTAYQKALQSQELLKSGKFLLNRRNSSSNIVFSYSPCGDTLLSSQKSSRLPGSRSAPGDCSPLSSRAELRDLPRFDQPNRWSDHATDQGKALSMSGALSRTFAIPSVSGPSWQTCEYHTHLLFVDKSQQSSSKLSISTLTAGKLLGKVARQGCVKGGSGLGIGQPEGFHLSVRQSLNSKSSCQCSNLHRHLGFKRSLQIAYCQNIIGDGCYGGGREKPEKRDLGGGNLPYGSLVLHILRTGGGLLWVGGPNAKGFHDSSAFLNSARAAPDMTFDGSSKDDTLDDSQAASDQALLGDRVLKLLSGACYLPHPDKEETGGEDAHFICVAEQAIGVADGVGGWAQMGVNAGEYARELMAQSVVAIQEEPRGSIDLARVLEKAYLSTKSRGSSTACILALSDQGLHAVNLGDSGFLVVRDGCTIFRSPVQQHDFNFTFQLECGDGSDLPSSAQVFTLQVAPGDVIIAGTDGLFDNLYNSEVTAVVVHAVRAGLGPQITAQKIAALARQRAQDRHRQTPFSTAAQDAGFRYYGGKLDDITVVVSYVTAEEVQGG